MTEVPRVLFVCIHTAGRPQMAAALLDHEAQGRVMVTSAGSQPARELNPAVRPTLIPGGAWMSRVRFSIKVSHPDAAVASDARLFGAQPAKLRAGYANFPLDDPPLKLVLNSPGNGPGGGRAPAGGSPKAGGGR